MVWCCPNMAFREAIRAFGDKLKGECVPKCNATLMGALAAVGKLYGVFYLVKMSPHLM